MANWSLEFKIGTNNLQPTTEKWRQAMFSTLVGKEITETVLDLRFVIATLLCVVLIPLGMYVSRKDYERRLASYQWEHKTYRQRHGTPAVPVTGREEAQGFRPPSILSIFASALAPFLPDKIITSYTGLFRTVKEPGADNPQSLLFGKADLLFNVAFIVSLAALIFTFNSISGEKEKGTLRLMIANSILRSRILLSKIVGKYIALLIPFVVSVLIALLVLDASPDVSIASSKLWPAFLVIMGITLLFILDMVSLGICISTFTKHSMGSIVLLLFVWVMFVLAVPKISPMIAEIFCPVEAGNVISFNKRMIREDIEKEFQQVKMQTIDSKRDEERDIVIKTAGEEFMSRLRDSGREPTQEDYKELSKILSKIATDTRRVLIAKYEPQVDRLVEQCERRIASEIKKIEQDYRNKRNVQFSMAMNLCRISPISCYAYIVSGLSGTGVNEPDNLIRNAQRFQDQVKQVFYDKVSWGLDRQKFADGFDVFDPPSFPDMRYRYLSLTETLQIHWPDILLLGLFDLLFCSLAFMRFNKYDVR